MPDLRALLGDKYEATIEKVTDAIAGDTDYFGCSCCTSYDYYEGAARTGEDERERMAAHDALAAVLPDLLAAAWDEGHRAGCADPYAHYHECDCRPNPYRQGDPQ